MSVGRSLKPRKAEIIGNKRHVFSALEESNFVDILGFGG
jgi:hypothetical protein